MGASGGDGDSEFSATSALVSSPKRQYLIAPRVGRAAQTPHQTIWSALEEATFSSPGQIQPNRGFPAPLRSSSLMFLINNQPNRRIIGPRSGGLLPQARIGRRAAPIGLMPQPRVGRRSVGDQQGLYQPSAELIGLDVQQDSENQAGQQEVAVATLSDSSPLNEVLESILSG